MNISQINERNKEIILHFEIRLLSQDLFQDTKVNKWNVV